MYKIRALLILGFALPSVLLILVDHLEAEWSLGAFLDGALTSLWFTAFFAIGIWWLIRRNVVFQKNHARRALLFGLSAAAVTWVSLWGFWKVNPNAEHFEFIFALNSGWFLVMGLITAWWWNRTLRIPWSPKG
jgi:hypothetical protein